jgi:hypothetical protein
MALIGLEEAQPFRHPVIGIPPIEPMVTDYRSQSGITQCGNLLKDIRM